MALTPRCFWFLLNQVDRLRAEECLMQMQIAAAVGSQKSFETTLTSLQGQIGQIFVWDQAEVPAVLRVDPDTGLDPEFDREALRALKARHSAG
jgi:hypothetical protein